MTVTQRIAWLGICGIGLLYQAGQFDQISNEHNNNNYMVVHVSSNQNIVVDIDKGHCQGNKVVELKTIDVILKGPDNCTNKEINIECRKTLPRSKGFAMQLFSEFKEEILPS